MNTKEEVVNYLKTKYLEEDLRHRVDEAIFDFLDNDWQEDGDGYEDESEWYQDYGRGEAESQVRTELEKELLAAMNLPTGSTQGGYETYNEIIGQDIWDTIVEVFDFLDD